MLARQLARLVPHVVGIDLDLASIGLARRQDPHGKVGLVHGDFLTHPFAPASFGMITSVAALHHMDARAELNRMSQLLAPGGTLAIIGLAQSRLPADLPWEAAAVITHRGYKLTRTYWEQPSPVVWSAPHTYAEVQALARRAMPGVQYRRHPLWRYSLIWTKPLPEATSSNSSSNAAVRPRTASHRMNRIIAAVPRTRTDPDGLDHGRACLLL
jgi:SAM-dependent methyltransferase